MRNSIFTIMKKELARFFGDKRMAVTTIFLPGILIYVMYSFMGNAMGSMLTVEDEYQPSIEVVNLPDSVRDIMDIQEIITDEIDEGEIYAAKEEIAAKELDLCIIFPEEFDSEVASYEPGMGRLAPNVEIYYNSASTESDSAYKMMTGLLDSYEEMLSNKFDINAGEEDYDMVTDKDATGSIFSSMLPMLLIIFLFTGCMAVAPESIAGEKERGTIATMLITPVKRSQIAIGKIAALSVIALLSGASSTIGLLISLPKLMKDVSDGISGNVYTASDYVFLGIVILSTVLFIISVISILSAFAKTIKEAQTYISPFMIIAMLIGITAMFGNGAKSEMYYYFIPLYNSVQCMSGIFSFDFMPVNVIVTVLSNLAYSGIAVFILTRMFNSEKIIFSK